VSGAESSAEDEQDGHGEGSGVDAPGWDRAAMAAVLHDVPLEVSVELGRVQMTLGELSHQLMEGAILALDKAATAPLEVRVQSRLIARAEAVAIGERCGIRILELVGGKGR
jgi:flagellar motor switch protein FliN